MPNTTKGTPYVVSTDLVANYPTVSSDLANHIDANLQYNAQDINAQTGSGANAYTFALADASLYKLVTASNAATATYTVPPQSSVTWATGAVLRILNQGAGVVTLAGGAGVTLNGSVLTLSQYQYAEIHRTASNTWTVVGIATVPGLVKITDSTFTSVSTLSINNCFTSTYDNYRIVVNFTGSTSADVYMRLRVGGADSTGSVYYGTTFRAAANGTTSVVYADNPNAFWPLAKMDTNRTSYSQDIYRPAIAAITTHTASGTMPMPGVANSAASFGGGYHDAATAYDGFTIYPTSGNFTGTLRVYGYRN